MEIFKTGRGRPADVQAALVRIGAPDFDGSRKLLVSCVDERGTTHWIVRCSHVGRVYGRVVNADHAWLESHARAARRHAKATARNACRQLELFSEAGE